MERIPDDEWRCPRCQAKAEPLNGKVERLVTWRWAEHPVKGVESEMEDDVIAGTHHFLHFFVPVFAFPMDNETMAIFIVFTFKMELQIHRNRRQKSFSRSTGFGSSW
jgi:hypothetical protein